MNNKSHFKKIVLIFVFIMLSTMTVLFYTHQSYGAASESPPMGWNSFDSFDYLVNEAQVKSNADYMEANLKQYGWKYVCIDYCWYSTAQSGSLNQDANFNPKLNVDSYGRVMPDTTRFPSSANGQGFKPIADYIHSKGLKFGIHLMRGIPRQAVAANTQIFGTNYRASDIADKSSLCAWLNLMYGLNMNHQASQPYLNSLFQQYATWGVDFVKVDDLINPYGSPSYHQSEIEGYRKAIDNCGREMVLSTSPGATPLANASHIMKNANQWRMANDLWDRWSDINSMFDLSASWYPYAGNGHWPDADMIPIGKISGRWSNLTSDEKYTLMTLWCIIRSPLIWGGNLVENRTEELELMQNSEVIAVNQNSTNNHPIVNGNTPIWSADVPGSNDKYVAIFNRNNNSASIKIDFNNIGFSGSLSLRDLWAKSNIGTYSGSYTVSLGAHQSRLYRVSSGTGSTNTVTTKTPEITATPLPTTTPEASYVRFRNVATGLYIDGMGSTSSGSNVCQWGNSSSNNQQWTIVNSGDYVMIKNRATGLYLDGMGRTSNGSICSQRDSNSSTDQQWIQETVGSYVRLKNRATGLYLDGMGSNSNGDNLCQWGNSGSTNQQWQIQ